MTPSPQMWECGKGGCFSIFPHLKPQENTKMISAQKRAQKYSHKERLICLIQKKLDRT